MTQLFEDGEHPVAYYSKAFTVDEAKWSSNELEAIGVIKVFDHFRPYIWGVDFDLLSDNMNVTLTWLKGRVKGKLARWAARLAEFDGYMTIKPRSGRKHGNADGLSRMQKDPSERPSPGDDCMGLGVAPARELTPLGSSTRTALLRLAAQLPEERRADRSRVCTSPEEHSWLLNLTPEEEAKLMSTVRTFHEKVWKGDEGKAGRFAPLGADRAKLLKELRVAQHGDKSTQLEYARVCKLPQKTDRYYKAEDGLLLRKYVPPKGLGEPYWVIVVPSRLKRRVMSSYHDEGATQHVGVAKTLSLLKQRFWWKGMDKDVKNFVRSCPWCQKFKATLRHAAGSPIPKVVHGLNSMLSIDIAGPFDRKAGVPLHILTVVDVFSGYGEVYPIPGIRTAHVLEVLNTNWIMRHGPPKVVVTDRGSQFEGEVMDRWFRRLGIKHRRTTAYHPQTNAEAERFHRWIRERLSIAVARDGGDWFEHLARVVHSHNVSPIEGLGDVSPYLLWYGRRPVLPGDGGLALGPSRSTALAKDELDDLL